MTGGTASIRIKKMGPGREGDSNSPSPNFTANSHEGGHLHTRGPPEGRGEATARPASSVCPERPPPPPTRRPRLQPPPRCRGDRSEERTPKAKSDTSVSHRAKHWKHEIADVDQDHPGSSRGGGGGGGCARSPLWRGSGARARAAAGLGTAGAGGGAQGAGGGRAAAGGGDRWPMEEAPFPAPLDIQRRWGRSCRHTRRSQPMGTERSAARPRRNRGGQRGPRARGWLGAGVRGVQGGRVMAEKQRAANRRSPRPGAEGSAPRGSCSLAWVPDRPRAERAWSALHPDTRGVHTERAHTESDVHPDMKVTSCVRRDRLERFQGTRPRGLHWHARVTRGRVHGGSARAEPVTGEVGCRASKRRTGPRHCHGHAHTESLVNRTRTQERIPKDTQRGHTMQICTLPGSLPVAPLLLLLQSTKLTICICRMENPVPRLRCGHTFHIETCSPQKTVGPPFSAL